MSLQGKKIILGITGSIAAYKAALLTRLLIKAGAEVQVLMTPAAAAFIAPLTLSTLSKRPVYLDMFSDEGWNNHVELGIWADAMLIAPATATTLSKMATGLSDNILLATYLSAKCPVFFGPAMDLDMWKHPATVENIKKLQSFGNHYIPVGSGELASGLSGEGRMAEPQEIIDLLTNHFSQNLPLKGKTVMITAGPTFEALDPVRFLGNRSSGKMGIAVAEEAAMLGAKVHLILGPTHLGTDQANIEIHRVTSAKDMNEAAQKYFPKADLTVLAAAVADFRPKQIAKEKIKKGKSEGMELELERTTDIAAGLGKIKKDVQTIVGFALESEKGAENAQRKLIKKNFDFIVLNSLKDKGAGFQVDTNKVSFFYPDNKRIDFELKSKKMVARDILAAALDVIKEKTKA